MPSYPPAVGPDGPGCEKMIFICQLPEMDVDESTREAEQAPSVLGGTSYGSAADPLYTRMVRVTLNDTDDSGAVRNDNEGDTETITHDASGTAQDYRTDASFIAGDTQVTFLNPDGTTETVMTKVRIMQDTAGNTFIMPPPARATQAEIDIMTSRPIVSVTFSSDPADYSLHHGGVFTDRTCFPCLARGSLIETEQGPLPVEQLRVGMRIVTRDSGLKPILWIGSRRLGALHLATMPNLRPIRIRAGALGPDIPARDLVVSPQHRILIRSAIAQRMFGALEVLIPAKQLLQIDGIDVAEDMDEVEYFHILFDRHEVIRANGAETESLYTGPEALKSVGPKARAEIFALFPELRDTDPATGLPVAARILPSGRMARKLAVRHKQHGRALVD